MGLRVDWNYWPDVTCVARLENLPVMAPARIGMANVAVIATISVSEIIFTKSPWPVLHRG